MRPDLAPVPAPVARQATVREFLAVVFRRRWIILGLFLVTTSTVLWVAFRTPVEFISSGRVLIKRGEKQSVLEPSRQVMGAWEEELSSEIEVVKSHPVLSRAREFLKLHTDSTGGAPIRLDAKQVFAEVMGKSNVLSIAYVDGDPEVTQRVCDAVMRAYIEFRQRDLSLAYPRKFFETELESLKTELDRKTEERRRFSNESEVVDIDEQRRMLITLLTSLADRRSQAEADLAEARATRRGMDELKRNPNVDLPVFTSIFANESSLFEIKRRIIEQEARLAQLRERYREDSPDVVSARTTLTTLQDMLTREVDARLAMWEARIDVLEARVGTYVRDQAAARVEFEQVPDKETRIKVLEREIALLGDRYRELVQRSDKAKVTENTTVSLNLVLLSPAGRPSQRNTRDYVRLALAPAFSLIVGLGLAFFFDGLDTTVRTAGHAEEAIELPVLAAVKERRRGA